MRWTTPDDLNRDVPAPPERPLLDDATHAELLDAYLNPDIPPRELAEMFALSLPQLAAWAASPEARRDLDALTQITHQRAADLAPAQRARAAHTLAAIASTAPGCTLTPTECRANETARKAASALLAPLSRAPRERAGAPAPSSTTPPPTSRATDLPICHPSKTKHGPERSRPGPSSNLSVARAEAHASGLPAAAAATTTTAVAAAATAAATTTVLAGLGLVDRQVTPADVLPVDRLDRGVRLRGVHHLHEPEPARAPGLPVKHEARRRNLAVLREQLLELGLGRVERQVADIDLLHNSIPSALPVSVNRCLNSGNEQASGELGINIRDRTRPPEAPNPRPGLAPTRPYAPLMEPQPDLTPKLAAQAFVHALDVEDFTAAQSLLDPDCVYQFRGKQTRTANAIIDSYRAAADWARASFDSIRYESDLIQESPTRFRVRYADLTDHAGQSHRHECEQVFTFNSKGRIDTIEHVDLPGERERLDAFLESVGVSRRA